MQMEPPLVRPRRIIEAVCAASLLCGLSVVLVDRSQPIARTYSVADPHPVLHVALRASASALPVYRQPPPVP